LARHARLSTLETKSARLRLPIRRKPHSFTIIAPGISLGYRRCQGPGRWVVRVADGHGAYWTKVVAFADDLQDADSSDILNVWQAQDRARRLARGQDAGLGKPQTVGAAVGAYEADLAARGASLANAGRIRKHLTATLASKPIAILTARELAAWRDGLLAAGMKPVTLVRLCKAFKAALNLAKRRDHRIRNEAAWRDGLSGIAEGFASRNVQRLDDDQVRNLIAAAHAIDSAFGLYLETAAVTGARLSQISRLTVADLQADNGTPRLLMPTSRKGRNRKAGKRPVPITKSLATRLQTNRPAEAPLLLRADGSAWQSSQDGDHERFYRQAAERAGVTGTMYALRHSSIIRSLLANVPIRVVAAVHDTSTGQIEKVYSSHITDFADAVARPALLETSSPVGNIVKLPGGRRS
jgi:integrase